MVVELAYAIRLFRAVTSKVTVKMDTKINEDLLKERKKCSFNVQELTNYLDGGADATENRRQLGKLVLIYLFADSD